MLRRIKIEGYKSFKSLELELKPVTVIIGPNAAGKSNFLDALYLISKAVASKNLKEAFEGHRGLPLESFYYGEVGFEKVAQKDSIQCSFEIDVELSNSTVNEVNSIIQEKRKGLEESQLQIELVRERFMRYRLTLEVLPKTGYLRVMDEELLALQRGGKKEKKSRRAFLAKEGDKLHLRMERQGRPTYFDLGMEHTIISTSLYEPHHPHIVAFRRELEKWKTYYLEPKTLMREDVPVAETLGIGPRGENLAAFINSIKHRKHQAFRNLNLTLQQLLPKKPQIDVELIKEGLVGLRILENGLSFSSRLISEGTLRVIGLISSVHPESPSTLVGYEEPENGVHPIRLKMIADLLKNTAQYHHKQIIATTHSPIFPEYFDNENLFVCSKENNESVIKPFKSIGPIFRRQDIEFALTERILRGDFGG